MVNEDAALLNRPVTLMTPAALFDRRLQLERSPPESKAILVLRVKEPHATPLG
jgi:hypothetical protein